MIQDGVLKAGIDGKNVLKLEAVLEINQEKILLLEMKDYCSNKFVNGILSIPISPRARLTI